MTNLSPRMGYTLPVFACAAAVAALRWLRQPQPYLSVAIDLIEPPQTVEIPIEQVAGLSEVSALAITRSDPGDNLDLTRNTPIWALVEWQTAGEQITILGGEGIGKKGQQGEAAIYDYAQKLLYSNLQKLLAPTERIKVTIILSEGRQLAQRTSNSAFGVVEGLSLLGTTGISQPLSAPGQLNIFIEELQQKINQLPNQQSSLVFCVGENGLDLAQKLGIPGEKIVKTANWLGAMLVAGAEQKVKSILLFGYHGKLIKLAGGIFHTHHHLADGRLEIFTAHCANLGLPRADIQTIFDSPTAEAAFKYLRDLDDRTGSDWVNQVYGAIAATIDQRTQAYIRNHTQEDVLVGSVLFDRDRQIIIQSTNGAELLKQLCYF